MFVADSKRSWVLTPEIPCRSPRALVGPEVPKRVLLCAEPAGTPTHPEIAAAVRRAGEVLREHGYIVEDGEPPLR